MAKPKRGSGRRARGPGGADQAPTTGGESGGFLGQLGLAETGGSSPGLFGIAVALGLAILTYPVGVLIRRWRHRA